MSDFRKGLNEFFGDRRTSPMYKSFLISWILWNWNFLFIVFFEDAQMIFSQFGQLKSEYIYEIYQFNWFAVIHLFLGPVISILLFFWVFDKVELWFRNKANNIKRKQNDSDNQLKEIVIKGKELVNKESAIEISNLRKQLEIEKINSQTILQKKENEMEKLKLGSKKEKDTEIKILEQRNYEYDEIKSDINFRDAMKGLKTLIGHATQNEEIACMDKYGYILITYDLYKKFSLDINGFIPGNITDKGKFFLRKFISNNDIKHPYISKSSSESEIDLPF